MPGSNLLLSQLFQNFCAAGALVADDGAPGSGGQLINQLLRKARLRKGLERRGDMQSHHLPMPGHGILARARLIQLREVCKGFLHRLHTLEGMQIRHTQFLQIRNAKRIRIRRDMPKRIRPCIAVSLRIRKRAHAEGINNNRKYSLILAHFLPLFFLQTYLLPFT